MILSPSAHLLEVLDKQGVKPPATGFIVDEAEHKATVALIQRGHPHESQQQIEERADYKLIWDHYGVSLQGTERGTDLVNARRVQAIHQASLELNTEHLPKLQDAICEGLSEIAELSAKQHVEKISQYEAMQREIVAEQQFIRLRMGELYVDARRNIESLQSPLIKAIKYAIIWAIAVIFLLIALTALSIRAHAQIDCITLKSSGVTAGVSCAPFKMDFTGCTVVKTASTYAITCTAGGTNNPGGSDKQVQYNNAGLTFGGISNGTLGQVLISQGASAVPAFADPLVQGTQAAASASQPNPVMGGVWDGSALRALLGDSSGRQTVNINGTVPISGTVTTSPPSNASSNVAQINGVTPLMGNGVTGTGSQRVTIASDNSAFSVNAAQSGTWTVQPGNTANTSAWKVDGSAVTQPTNVAQVAGTTTDTNSGNKSAGTLRVVLATDQPALTNKLLVTPDSVALPANQSVNISQINAVTPLMGNGVTGTGSQRVTIASDNTAFAVNATLSAETTKVIGTARIIGNAGAVLDAATGAAPPANALLNAGLGSGATGGFLVGVPVSDTYKNINVSTATTTLLVTGVSGRQVRIGSLHMIAAGADNVALIEGTGATCGTGTAGMAGGTTAASGYNFAANGGISLGTGLGTVMQTATTGDSVCVVTSAAVQLSGGLQYTIY